MPKRNLPHAAKKLISQITKTRTLQVHVLFVQCFKTQEQGTTESKKYDHKHHAKATHVPKNHLSQCSGVQASGAAERKRKLI